MNYRDMSYEEFYNNVMSKIEDPLNDENLSKIVYMHKSDNKILLSGDHRFDFSSVFEDDIMTPEHSLSIKFVAYDYSSKAKFSDIFLKNVKKESYPLQYRIPLIVGMLFILIRKSYLYILKY